MRNVFAIRAQAKAAKPNAPRYRADVTIEPREPRPGEKLEHPAKVTPRRRKKSNDVLITPRSGQVRSRV